MHRYLLFHGLNYYPSGGMEDFKKSSDSLDELLSFLSEMECFEWCHIYDTDEEKIIFQSLTQTINIPFEYVYSWVVPEL